MCAFACYLCIRKCENESVSVWVSREADLETKFQVQVVYLGGDPRKHQ